MAAAGARSRGRVGSSPRTRIEPAVGRPRPMQHSSVVVLPAPLRPSNPKIVAGGTAKVMPSTAVTRPYVFTRPSTKIAWSTLM